ncbi:Ig-like domain-containing protein [Brevibacillus migulae]|uniref:Ig-like domain-containing protein n=1 Tax=Brevibacillus migulae TaxID=1644114 RepID=UPI00106E0875|nr:Ig-like domain-containing protein [Brevibacillus migulae]
MKALFVRVLLWAMLFSVFLPYDLSNQAHAADPEPDVRLIPVADKFFDYITGDVYPTGNPVSGADQHSLMVGYLNDELGESKVKSAVRYDLKDINRPILKATLTIPVHAVTTSHAAELPPTLIVNGSSDDDWEETSTAMPDGQEQLGTIILTPGVDYPTVKTFDVTDFVKRQMNAADKKASFLISGRESSHIAGYSYSYFNFFDRAKDIEDKMARLEIIYNPNSPPTDITLSSATIQENSAIGSTIGTLTTIDPDTGDSPTFTIVAGDTSSFTISSSNELKTAEAFDYEAKSNYNLTIQATDSGGNTFAKAFTISVTNQNEAPAGSLTINSGAATTASREVTLTITAADPESDSLEMRFSDDGTTWDGWTGFSATTSRTLSVGDGEKTVHVQLKDAANNLSNVYSDSIALDQTPPVGTVKINEDAAFTNSTNVTLKVVAGDAVKMRFANDASSLEQGAWENVAAEKSWHIEMGDGTKTVYMQLQDAGGNDSSPFSDSITLDTTPPEVIGVEDGVSYNTDRTIAFAEGNATLDGSPFSSGSTVSDEGTHTFILTDHIGNTNTIHFTIDKTSPTGSVSIDSGKAYTNDLDVTLTVASGDGKWMRFSNDPGNWDDNAWVNASTEFPWTIAGGGDGTKTVYMQLRDALGNVSSSFSDTIVLDTTAPVVTGVADGDRYNTVRTISFNEGTAKLNHDDFTSGGTVSAEGSYTLVVTDEAGNQTTVHFSIDTTSPQGTLEINGGASHTNKRDVTLHINYGDAERMRFTNDPGNWNDSTWVNAASQIPWTVEAGDGTKTVYMQLRDALGNVSSNYSDTIELDTTAPVVTGVTDGASYNTDRTISFSEGTAKLNNVDFVDGTTISAEGSYTLVVTDAAGNQTTVQFTIDRTPPQGTLSINNGATSTGSASVSLEITSSDTLGDVEMRLSNDDTTWTGWEPAVSTKAWRLAGGDGTKTVYLELRDEAGNLSKATASIRLDTYQPPPYYPVTGVSLDKHSMNLRVNETDRLQVVIEPANATNKQVRWSSSDPRVVEVDESGKVTAKKPGSAVITVTTVDGQMTDRCEVTVKEAASFRLEASDSTIHLHTGETARFQIYFIEDGKRKEITNNKETSYSVDNDLIAIKPGQVTAGKDEGESTITVSYQGEEITIQVTVEKESVRLQASKSSFWLKPEGTARFKVYAYEGKKRKDITNDKDTSYETDNELVTLKAGRITAGDDEGESLITVRYQGEELTIPVTVSKLTVKSLAAATKQAIMEVEEERQLELTATFNDKSSKDVTDEAYWSSSDTDVVKVSESGELTAVGRGTAVVTGAYGGREGNVRILVVKEKAPKQLRVSRTSVTISAEKTLAIKATAVYEKGYQEEVTSEVEWEADDPDIAVVEDGEIIGVSAGSTKITGSYLGKTVTIKVTVRE